VEPSEISARVLAEQIDRFLDARGYGADRQAPQPLPVPGAASPPVIEPPAPEPLDFVCEEDVRRAIDAGRKLVVAERAIVTPSARDLGERHQVFTQAPWRG